MDNKNKKMKFRKSDVYAYLEEKIHWDEESDEEYDFYIALRDEGYKVFEYEEYHHVIKNIMKEMREYYTTGGNEWV